MQTIMDTIRKIKNNW